MANIKPFRGLRYNRERVDPAMAISQPYDRVRYGLQDKYYALNPYNIVRIIRGKELPSDIPDQAEGPNVYTRARSYLELWQAEDVLIREEKPAVYVYHQSFMIDGVPYTRKGFIAAFELCPFGEGIVLPHERTHAGPKVDRLHLTQSIAANVGQIFMLYPDPQNQVSGLLDVAIAGKAPDLEAHEMYEQDVRQQMWVVTDPATIESVQAEMSSKRNLIIADGHHRYETAINYRDKMRARYPDAPPNAAFNYRMVTMVSMDDPGLVILPTHREIFDYPQITPTEAASRVREAFDVIPVADLDACLSTMQEHVEAHAFGMYGDGRYHVLVLKSPALIEQYIPGPRSMDWKSLDVSIAHKILLEQLLRLPAEAAETQSNVRYHRDPKLGIENVNAGRGNFCVLLNPTRIGQVKSCAGQGEKMPQKSTDFYPKMVSGLTLMPIPAEELI